MYYLAQRLWLDAFGTGRLYLALPIVFGLLSVFAIAWFAYVLAGRRAGLIALALAAVSPFSWCFAQQLREYGLFAGLVALVSGCFVLALRGGGVLRWAAFAAALALALWTYPLAALLLPAYAVSVAYAHSWRRAGAFFVACVLALAAFTPWLVVMLQHHDRLLADNVWSATPYPPPALLAKFAFSISSAFTDLVYADPRGALASAFVFCILAWAAVVAARRASAKFVLLCSMLLTTGGALLLADLLGGTHRSASTRYLTASIVAVLVLMAVGLARLPRRWSVALTAALVVVGGASSYLGSSAPMWWDNYGDGYQRTAALDLQALPDARLLYQGPCSYILPVAWASPQSVRVDCGVRRLTAGDAGSLVLAPTPRFLASTRDVGLIPVTLANEPPSSAAVRALHAFAPASDDGATFVRLVPFQ